MALEEISYRFHLAQRNQMAEHESPRYFATVLSNISVNIHIILLICSSFCLEPQYNFACILTPNFTAVIMVDQD